MRTLLNILWHFPLFGFVTAATCYLIGLILVATVVAAPIGSGLMEYGKFLLSPFSSAMVSKNDLDIEQNEAWKAYGTIITICYLPFGIMLAMAGIIQALFLCLTIVGIPFAVIIAKSMSTMLNPVNKKCVSRSTKQELDRRKGAMELDKLRR